MKRDINVIVVCGGVSSERDVSLRSGNSIFRSLLRLGYRNAKLFDFNLNNISDLLELKPDIVFIGLHGKGGEDGTIQGFLDLAGIPYTGPGVASSAICMNKILTKRILSSANLPTAPFLTYRREDFDGIVDDIEKEAASIIGYPMVLKSPCEGSSIGVEIVHNAQFFETAVENIFKYGKELLIESFIEGVEVTLPILGNDDITCLPIIEITSERDFYDYTAKYTEGMCHHIIPASITEEDNNSIIDIGLKAYKVLGCKGLSRIDFIVDKEKGPIIIEVNTLPGMTDMSLFPDAARYAGISYDQLVEMILELGMDVNNVNSKL